MSFSRITVEHDKMGGTPCIRSLRIPVATIVAHVAAGQTEDQFLSDYPDLVREDIREALQFAACMINYRDLPFPEAS